MIEKKPLVPDRIHKITGSFAFIEHRFLHKGFWTSLTQHEVLLYIFLVLAADRQGLSYYSFDKICSLLAITPDKYILARNALIEKDLVAFDGLLFQVLSLPEQPVTQRVQLLTSEEDMEWRIQPLFTRLSVRALEEIMIDKQTIFEIHRLADQGVSIKKISEILVKDRKTVRKYLNDPQLTRKPANRKGKLDPFKNEIDRLLTINAGASAVVIQQRLAEKGYDGGLSILKNHLKKVRGTRKRRAYIRFESEPGHQCQIDWGHFGSLDYDGDRRKLYCLAIIESHSRMLYVEFTHSQNQETLHRCLLNGFRFFRGTPKKLVHDNMLTAVIEREGRLVRFNDSFLEFLRPFKITPVACNPAQPQEKGKVEKGGIHYIRHNFWPLRTFSDLRNVQNQADQWRDDVANVRLHATTGQRPIERIRPEALRPLPDLLPDCRETKSLKVHTDFSICFDANRYTVPPRFVGKQVIAKADNETLTVYYNDKKIAGHNRCWQRKQRIELPAHREAASNVLNQKHLSEDAAVFISLGEIAKIHLEKMAAAGLPIKKNLKRLLHLKDEYGHGSLLTAIKRANNHNAYGADYIENILYQEMTPRRNHPPVRVKNEDLNRIRLIEPNLAEYDTYVLKRRK